MVTTARRAASIAIAAATVPKRVPLSISADSKPTSTSLLLPDKTSTPASAHTPTSDRTVARAADPSPLSVLRTHTLATLAHRELERMILSGHVPAGGKLNEADVAAQLGVSRGPVREAFRSLEETGLVRIEKNRGVFVRQISVEEADEIYDVRASLDAMIGHRVAGAATAEQIAQLRSLIAQMEGAVARSDSSGYYAANIEFHDSLARFAGNAKLLEMYRRLVNELSLYRRKTFEQGAILPTSVREHRRIVEAIVARNGDLAGKLMRDHALASRERMHAGQLNGHAAKSSRARATRAKGEQ